jgi:peptidoglycan/xylan/chitin deacetylase (PgdA/CDA1 family)
MTAAASDTGVRPGGGRIVGMTFDDGPDRHLRHQQTPRAIVERDTADALATLARLGVRPSLWRVPRGACADWTALGGEVSP